MMTRSVLILAALAAAGCGRERSSGAPPPRPTTEWGGREAPVVTPTEATTPGPSPQAQPTTGRDMAMRLDADMKKVIDQMSAAGAKPIDSLAPADARKQPTPADAVKAVLSSEGKSAAPEAVGKTEDRKIAGAAGPLPVRIYTPRGGKAPYPVTVYFHGGGFVLASNDVYDASARAIANAADSVVVAVDYRQAPEHKFPAAHDDAFAAYKWAVRNAASFGGDAKRVAVAGESAGGNLAESVAIAARDHKEQLPVHALLIYPVASGNLDTPSERQYAEVKPLNRAMMSWFTTNYFRTPADGADPRINLVNADLHGLPATTIINAEIDPLRSDGELLADKLRAAGVSVEQKTYEGVTHEFFGMGAVVSDARDAVKLAGERLKQSFGS